MKNFLNWMRAKCVCVFLAALANSAIAMPNSLKQQILADSIKALETAKHSVPLQIPVNIRQQDLLKKSIVRAALLSPDGQWVAAITRSRDELHQLILLNTTNLKIRRLLKVPSIKKIHWSDASQHLLIQMDDRVSLLNIGQSSTKLIYRLNESQKVIGFTGHGTLISEELVAGKKYQTQHIGLKGEERLLVETEKPVTQAWHDAVKNISLFRITNGNTHQFYSNVNNNDASWLSCATNYRCQLVGFDSKNKRALILTNKFSDKTALYQIDLQSGIKQWLHNDPLDWVDIAEVKQFTNGWLVGYIDTTTRYHTTNERLKAALAHMHSKLKASYFELDINDKGSLLLINSIDSSHRFPSFYIYRVKNQKLVNISKLLGEHENTVRFNRRLPIHYTASDGRVIHGFVTLPRGVNLKKAPLIAQIHGGPWTRVYPAFSSLVQMLSLEGYIVFEPNFRASSGYGRDYLLAANKDFGKGRVHQDIVEGIEYLLDLGIGDSRKLGIMGHSFGGFSTLGALAYQPDFFQAGIATAAPHDMGQTLALMAKNSDLNEDGSLLAILKARVADPENPDEMKWLYNKSPDAHKQFIVKPLLMQAGAKDRKVKIEAMKGYVAELNKLAKPVSLFVDKDAGHAFDSELMRKASYELYRAFWAKYLKGESRKIEDPEIRAYLKRTQLLSTKEVEQIFSE